MNKSTHSAVVAALKNIQKRMDADYLSVAYLDSSDNAVIRTSDWESNTKGIFIPPESLCDTLRAEFAFMHRRRQWEKINVKRLCDVVSYHTNNVEIKIFEDFIDIGIGGNRE